MTTYYQIARCITRDYEKDLVMCRKLMNKYGFPLTWDDLERIYEKDDEMREFMKTHGFSDLARMCVGNDYAYTPEQIANREKIGIPMYDTQGIDYIEQSQDKFNRLVMDEFMKMDTVYVRDEVVVRIFMDLLNRRQKRLAKKGNSNRYDGWIYYVAHNGRLAKVINNCRKPTGLKLLKQKRLFYDDYGILRARDVINEGITFKHRRLIEEVSRNRFSTEICERLGNYFDGCKDCNLVIDRDFYKAYDPIYRNDYALEGDLVTGQSCMSGRSDDADQFYGGIHGCYVVRFETTDGEQVGRCIMYEFNGIRHFIRIYCQPDYGYTCLRLLRNEMKPDDIFGRNKRIENMVLDTDWDYDTPSMYLDGNFYGLDVKGDEFKVATGGEYDLHEVSESTIGNAIGCRCEHCGDIVSEDEAIWVDDHCYCCSSCAHEDGYYQCDWCGEWFYEDDGYFADDGRCWCCDEHMNKDGYYQCDKCNQIEYQDDGVFVDDTFYCCEDCARDDGYEQCIVCGDWYKRNDMILLDDAYYCRDCHDEQFPPKEDEEQDEQNN